MEWMLFDILLGFLELIPDMSTCRWRCLFLIVDFAGVCRSLLVPFAETIFFAVNFRFFLLHTFYCY